VAAALAGSKGPETMKSKLLPAPVSLMDTTLRDGEQTPDLAFDADEKLQIARALLCDVNVDRIEIGSARVSVGERLAARRIAAWARAEGLSDRIEMLGFCDGQRSIDWIADTGVERVNLLVKGSERHCRLQLGMSLHQHIASIGTTLEAAARAGLALSGVYLEDWSRGVVESTGYVDELATALEALGVRRVYLADTLGVLEPAGVARHVRRMCRRFPGLAFEFHAHDDYGLATANALAAVRAGASGLHATVNGLGERGGNASLAELVVALRDHARRPTAAQERGLPALSALVARASGYPVPHNAPVVGRHVFTQTAGVHADGDAKGNLYASRLAPERFGRERQYALGKLAGRASLAHHLQALGVVLDPAEFDALLAAVVARGDKKQRIRREDLPRMQRELCSARAEAAEKTA
jgi:D-citramalate synthase